MNKDMEISSCSIDQGYTYQFPVCARDFAFYFAMLLGGIFILALGKDKDREIPSLIFLFIFVLPTAIDGLTQLFGIRESNNQLRIATGFLAGIIVPFYVIPIMNRVFNKGAYNARKRSRIRS
ncbi:MAG: DUF2085 domain-containing protein [Candidatus Micrarchaeota archaeon]|nr:DUF2085 domain-containing protein [Candidatus Micrarchaeota archaeon]